MGGAPQNLIREVFEKKIVRWGGGAPPTMGNPDISKYTRKFQVVKSQNMTAFTCNIQKKIKKLT